MNLKKENIADWKIELDKIMKSKVGMTLSETKTDEEWLEDCEGFTAQEVVKEEISYWCK